MTTLHGFSKNQDMSTNVMMPYLNDSRLYFLIFENCLTTKKVVQPEMKTTSL